MGINHTFYIANLENCVNIEGLIKYLAEKISVAKMCLYCPLITQKQYKSREAVQSHMVYWSVTKDFKRTLFYRIRFYGIPLILFQRKS